LLKLTQKHFNSITQRNRYEFPLYSKPILNIATQNSKATSVKIVGSMKEQFSQFLSSGGRTLEEWEQWYEARGGKNKIQQSADKLYEMLEKMPVDNNIFTRDLAYKYIEELVYNKTHYGMSGEYHAVVAAAEYFESEYKFSTPEEESQGIDAWIGSTPVQVKPHDSVKMHHVRNHADEEKTLVITYEAKKDACYIHNPDFLTKERETSND
jgi:hypothetical protein